MSLGVESNTTSGQPDPAWFASWILLRSVVASMTSTLSLIFGLAFWNSLNAGSLVASVQTTTVALGSFFWAPVLDVELQPARRRAPATTTAGTTILPRRRVLLTRVMFFSDVMGNWVQAICTSGYMKLETSYTI